MIILQCECNYPFWIEFVYFSAGMRKPIFLDHQEARFQFFDCPQCGKKIRLKELKRVERNEQCQNHVKHTSVD